MAEKQTPTMISGHGIGLEYFVVDEKSMAPLVVAGISNLGERVTWSTAEGVTRVRISSSRAYGGISTAAAELAPTITSLGTQLTASGNGILLPCGAHPFSSPSGNADPEGNIENEHSWTSSLRIELPFADEQEFGRLHTAIRMVLPLVPAISASSPYVNGARAGALSARLLMLLEGAWNRPEPVGAYIPEVVLDQADYFRIVLEPIARHLVDRGLGDTVDYQAANQRGAVPSFERNVITITVADTQESLASATAVAELTTAVVMAMKEGRWVSNYLQRAWHESDLRTILLDVVRLGSDAIITNRDFLLMFGQLRESATAGELWRHLYRQLRGDLSEATRIHIGHILDNGNLAQRILRRTGEQPSHERIVETYQELCACLKEDKPLA